MCLSSKFPLGQLHKRSLVYRAISGILNHNIASFSNLIHLDTGVSLLLILRAVLNLLSLTNALYERVSQSDAARIMTAAVAGQKKQRDKEIGGAKKSKTNSTHLKLTSGRRKRLAEEDLF